MIIQLGVTASGYKSCTSKKSVLGTVTPVQSNTTFNSEFFFLASAYVCSESCTTVLFLVFHLEGMFRKFPFLRPICLCCLSTIYRSPYGSRQCYTKRRSMNRLFSRPRNGKIFVKILFGFIFLIAVASWHLVFDFHSPARALAYGNLRRPEKPKLAIATFLNGNSQKLQGYESIVGEYSLAARVLAYQLLHANETRCKDNSIPFLVVVTSTVSNETRRQLESDGAKVVPVEDVPLPGWIKTGVTRWSDQFTKLRLFDMVEYDRILFLDADTFITRPIDGIFDEPIFRTPYKTLLDRRGHIKSDEFALVPSEYMFAARSDNALTGGGSHPFPPLPTSVFSAGFWIAAPSHEIFVYLLSVMSHHRRFHPHTMEQSLLNYAFRRDAGMPWLELDYRWSATWPNERDVEGGVASLHEKFWKTGNENLQRRWEEVRQSMEEFYREKKD
jgi:alpha-N-acetylglucosamine transferase